MTCKSVFVLAAVVMLPACSFWRGSDEEAMAPVLADLAPAQLPVAGNELPVRDLDDIAARYQAALEVVDDPDTRGSIMRRLASLEMLQSEQRQIEQNTDAHYYTRAIEAYRELLSKYPDRPDNDQLIYQIAKASELDGRTDQAMTALDQLVQDYPDSSHYTEAQFRRAEIFFSRGNYSAASKAYQAVISTGKDSAYYRNAMYMYGWSLFKRNQYYEALTPFTHVMDQLLANSEELDGLDRSSLQMARDSLRVMSLALSYQDGATTIEEVYDQLGQRAWQHLLYDQLGELYLNKERFRDAAQTWQAYIERYSKSAHSPRFSVKIIDVYRRGDFPSSILPAKQKFVSDYGVNSKYWAAANDELRNRLRPHLHSYLSELAKHQHALAQQLQRRKKPKPVAKEISRAFLRASEWYAQFIATFPHDKASPEMTFLMAESLFEAGELPGAIEAYERVAYPFSDDSDNAQTADKRRGAEAGYSAILTCDRLIQTLNERDRADWQLAKIVSSQRFARVYPTDSRAAPVQTKAAEELLALEEYDEAVDAAEKVTSWQPDIDPALRRTAWLVKGHSYFQLTNYVAAEKAWQKALLLMQGKTQDKARNETIELLSATVYKRAEQLLSQHKVREAVAEFIRVREIAPNTKAAAIAQYDAAAYLIRLQEWQRAEQVLTDFRARYPDHTLIASIPAKLAKVYQQMENWQSAARELSTTALQTSSFGDDPDMRRQSLYLAAEMFEKADSREQAIEHYKRYIGSWPQPFDLAMEARYRLTELYRQNGNGQERRFWLEQLMEQNQLAGSNSSERSRYLAAFSAIEIAEEEFARFQQLSLTLPLKQSLKKKRESLEKNLTAYNRALEPGIAPFATQANYRIGSLYMQLAKDLMASERPRLNQQELEQYELLLEEQAFPFEEKAIAIHEANAKRTQGGIYDQWVKRSFTALGELLPGRYLKREHIADSAYMEETGHDTYNRLAVTSRLEGEFARAEQLYQKALDVAPDSDIVYRNLGILYDLYLGDLASARRHYQAYQKLQSRPDNLINGWIKDIDRRIQAMASLGGPVPGGNNDQ